MNASLQHRFWIAALVHSYGWKAGPDKVWLSPGTFIAPARSSRAELLYHDLCRTQSLDEGEPLDFEVMFVLEPSIENRVTWDYGDPYSAIDRLCNVLTIFAETVSCWIRVLDSADHFRTARYAKTIHTSGSQTEWLQNTRFHVTDDVLRELAEAWRRSDQIWRERQTGSRIINALTFFSYAWHAHYLEQVCLNLAIVLECLFAPHSQSETTHQLAFNCARFSTGDPAERERIFEDVRRFYRLRSAIVHGGSADQDELIEQVPRIFTFAARTLRRILLDAQLCSALDNEMLRKQLLRAYLFT